MPATYSYNDAIEDAKRAVARAWESGFETTEPEKHMKIILAIMGALDHLKRPSRRKRLPKLPITPRSPLDKILDEDRIKGPAHP